MDLKDRAAVERLLPLIGEADVLVQNLKPGSLEALGLGAEALTARFPRLIYCCVWAFGRTGPMKLKPGYEPMVQAFSSLMWLSGDEDDPPTRMGTSVLDFGTGMWAAMGVLAALEQRHRTGQGCVVDTSLFALNTSDLDTDEAAREAIAAAESETGLATDDVVRFGPERVLDAVVAALP